MIKRLFILCLAVLSAVAHVTGQELRERLRTLDGVMSVDSLAPGEFAEKYEVMLTQTLDPKNPNAGTFGQRVVVMHAGFDRPTVLITQGYDAKFCLGAKYRDELSRFFDANIVVVEHRYFEKSKPEPIDWVYLTAENSACDLHTVKTLFQTLYPGKWIASGISKGGSTTMLYAAYFPGDVDVYVPYVGPLCTSREDKRFNPFMEQVSTPENRGKVLAFQIEMMRRRDALMPAFEAFCNEKGYTFNLPLDEMYDYTVLEYGISFWQWGYEIDQIPSLDAADDKMLGYLLKSSDPGYFSRDNTHLSFYVQASRELGYYPYNLKPFRKYTVLKSTKGYLGRIFVPEELNHEKFSKKLCRKVTKYLKNNDPQMMMVYGSNDPWTAPGAAWCVTPDKRNMKAVVVPQGDHRARISSLPEPRREQAIATLRGWLEN